MVDDINLALEGMVVPTKKPERAILSLESSRMHIFLLKEIEIHNCLWDGCITYEDKKSIMTNMLTWLKKIKKYNKKEIITGNLVDFEDVNVFEESINDLKGI